MISYKQKLSEEFIREFSNKIHWPRISICQNIFSRDFLIKYLYNFNYKKLFIVRYYIGKIPNLSIEICKVINSFI